MQKQRRRSVTAKLISAFVFAARIVQSLYFLNPKFQASSHLLWLYSPACVGPGRKPRRPVFSQRGSINCYSFWNLPLSFDDIHTIKNTHVTSSDCFENSDGSFYPVTLYEYCLVCETSLHSVTAIFLRRKMEGTPSSTFLVNGYAYILPYRLHTYLGLNIDGSPY